METKTMTNAFCWAELTTPDIPQAQAFYGSLYGFGFDDMATPDGPYSVVRPANGHGGGIMGPVPDIPREWMPYVEVDGLESVLARLEPAGGTVVFPPNTLQDGARISWVLDPEGVRLGLYEAGPESPPTPATDPAGAPHFCYYELTARGPEAARAFYGELFGWRFVVHQATAGEYTEIETGGRPGGGIQPGAPTGWLAYIKVPDVAVALAAATAAGATTVAPPRDICEGTIAAYTDPAGARVGLFASA